MTQPSDNLTDNLTLAQARAVLAMFGGGQGAQPDILADAKPIEGATLLSSRVEGDLRPVIVRARDAGVHFGKLVAYDRRTVWLRDARRLWSWRAKDGIALSGVAVHGIDASKSKVDALVSNIVIFDACEIIDATAQAAASIEAA